MNLDVKQIAQALFIINRHSKTALNPKELYDIKRKTILLLLKQGYAQKIGLHYSNNPKFSQQHLDVLVKVDEYLFHIPPTKEDIKSLPNLGKLDNKHANPKASMSLSSAKKICFDYLSQNGVKLYHMKNNPLKTTYRRTNHPTQSSDRRVTNQKRFTSTWINR